MRTAKTLIRLGRRPSWSESSLGAHHFLGFVMRWLMFHFREIEHVNIVKLLGQCTETLPFLVIMEFPPLVRSVSQPFTFEFTCRTASSEFGTYRLCEQRRFRRACASAQSRQNLCCWLIQAVNQEELSDRKPDPWPLWMAGHAQLKFVMKECSKTQIRLTGLMYVSSISVLQIWLKPRWPSKLKDFSV